MLAPALFQAKGSAATRLGGLKRASFGLLSPVFDNSLILNVTSCFWFKGAKNIEVSNCKLLILSILKQYAKIS